MSDKQQAAYKRVSDTIAALPGIWSCNSYGEALHDAYLEALTKDGEDWEAIASRLDALTIQLKRVDGHAVALGTEAVKLELSIECGVSLHGGELRSSFPLHFLPWHEGCLTETNYSFEWL